MGIICVNTTSEESLAHLGDDCVVDDSTLLVGEAAERASTVLEAGDVAHHQGLDKSNGVLALHKG